MVRKLVDRVWCIVGDGVWQKVVGICHSDGGNVQFYLVVAQLCAWSEALWVMIDGVIQCVVEL